MTSLAKRGRRHTLREEEEVVDEFYEFNENNEAERRVDLGTRRRSVSLSSSLDFDDVELEPEVRMRVEVKTQVSKRPSSVLVHDNDELLRIADELQRRDQVHLTTPASSLVRRNSSGYHSSSSNKPEAAATAASTTSPANCSNINQKGQTSPRQRKTSHGPYYHQQQQRSSTKSFKNSLRRGSVNPTEKAENVEHRRASVAIASPTASKATSSRPSSSTKILNHLFGSSGKRSSTSSHHKARKYERQHSSNLLQVHQEENNSKRAQFLSAGRSATGLSLFGAASRRRSVAVSNEAFDAIRQAKSHVDLTHADSCTDLSSGSVTPVNLPTPGPSLTDLKEASKRQKAISFKERSWSEIEKLWRGKAKEPPNIEAMFKSRSSFRHNKTERSARSKTIPLETSKSPTPSTNSTPTSAYTSQHSIPLSTRKAIDLMAPHVLSEWHLERGYPTMTSILQRRRASSSSGDLPKALAKSQSEDVDHFKELVKGW